MTVTPSKSANIDNILCDSAPLLAQFQAKSQRRRETKNREV
jgi:hypothetical protein